MLIKASNLYTTNLKVLLWIYNKASYIKNLKQQKSKYLFTGVKDFNMGHGKSFGLLLGYTG